MKVRLTETETETDRGFGCSANDHPTRMGDRKKQSHKDGRRGSLRDPVVFFFFRYPFGVFPPIVRRVLRVRRQRDGGFHRAFLQRLVPQVGPLRFVLFCLFRGPEAVAYLVCLWAHKVSTRPPRGRCVLSWTATDSQFSGRPVAFEGATQLNQGSNPKTGRVRDPFNQKDLAKRQVHVGSAMRKVLIARE